MRNTLGKESFQQQLNCCNTLIVQNSFYHTVVKYLASACNMIYKTAFQFLFTSCSTDAPVYSLRLYSLASIKYIKVPLKKITSNLVFLLMTDSKILALIFIHLIDSNPVPLFEIPISPK